MISPSGATRIVLASSLLCAACGSNYEPPDLPTNIEPAGQVGQVLDFEVSFPALRVAGASFSGVKFEVRVEMERTGTGSIPARLHYGRARLPMGSADVVDLSNGRASITVTPESWFSDRLGPLRIETTMFEMILDGAVDRQGWHLTGRSWESMSSSFGTFEAWRRHRFLVAGTDFFSSVGRLAEVSLIKEREIAVRHRLELVSSDPFLRVSFRSVFAINRFTFDNLQRLDPLQDFTTSWQTGVGVGSNPQDILVLSEEKGYVTRYEPPYNDVAVVDPGNGRVVGSIPLAPFAENRDLTPRPTDLRVAEGTVFVALQDIDRSFSRYGEGKLVTIDPERDETTGSIALGGKNPFDMNVVTDDQGRQKIYVALAGIFPSQQELSGGVVAVDALNRTLEGLVLDDDAVGGNISALAMVSTELGYVVASDENFVNRVIAFDPRQGLPLRTLVETPELIPGLALDSMNLLAVPDRRFFDPQVCLYRVPDNPDSTEQLVSCITMELPPFSIEPLD